MADHTTEVLVGGGILAAAAGFLIYAAQLTGTGAVAEGVASYRASFNSVEGISVGTDVRMGGVKIGRVTDLSLNAETYRAEMQFTVEDRLVLPEDTAAVVASEGLLGGSYIELLPGGSAFDLEPGSEVQDTQSAVSLINLLLKFVSGGPEDNG